MKTIYKISSTSLGKSGCLLNFHRTVALGYKELAMKSNLVYGIAVHKFIDVMFKTGDMLQAQKKAKEAFALPKLDDKRSMHLSDERHMLTTCLNIWTNWIEEDGEYDVVKVDNIPLTEQTFEFKYYEDDYIIVYLCGTLDSIGQIRNGCYCIRDWKTTSSWDNVGYFKTYELSKQLRFYRLALRIMGEREPESTLGKIGLTNVGACIDAIFIKPNANDNVIKRSNVFQYRKETIDEFEQSLKVFINELSHAHLLNRIHLRQGILNGSCESKWGRCAFWNVCCADRQVEETLLKRDFKQVKYEPSNYNDI